VPLCLFVCVFFCVCVFVCVCFSVCVRVFVQFVFVLNVTHLCLNDPLFSTQQKMSDERKTHTVTHVQTLTVTLESKVFAIDIRIIKDINAVILITGLNNGDIIIYKAPLSLHTGTHTRMHFTAQHQFKAGQVHAGHVPIYALHMHYHKTLFITASMYTLKVWNFTHITAPRLMKIIRHKPRMNCAKYSQSGLIATGCNDFILRVYEKEPLYALRWSFKASGQIVSVAWSPSNRIAAAFEADMLVAVRVWDSSFQPLFKFRKNRCFYGNCAVVFASNNLLMWSGHASNKVYWYHMSKPKVMNVFTDTNVLPFCRDVLKIIITTCHSSDIAHIIHTLTLSKTL